MNQELLDFTEATYSVCLGSERSSNPITPSLLISTWIIKGLNFHVLLVELITNRNSRRSLWAWASSEVGMRQALCLLVLAESKSKVSL